MQSQSTQASRQNIIHPTEETRHSAQYGLPLSSSELADLPSPHDGGVFLHGDEANTSASNDAEVVERFRQTNLNGHSENRERPSFQRIAEYENALMPQTPKKEDEGPAFKIVKKKKGHTLDGPQLDKFPNGMYIREITATPLTLCRGLDTYPIASSCLVSRRCFSCIALLL